MAEEVQAEKESIDSQESLLLEKQKIDILLFDKVRELFSSLSKTKDWISDVKLQVVCACLLIATVVTVSLPIHYQHQTAVTATPQARVAVLKQTAKLLADKQNALTSVQKSESVQFYFEENVPADQQEQIRDGINKSVEIIKSSSGVSVKNLKVYAYTDYDKLIDQYLKNSPISAKDSAKTRQKLTASTAFAGENADIYINCSSPGWLTSSPIIGGPIVEGRYNTLIHEYFHLVQNDLGAFNAQFPTWLNEGSCQYVAARGLENSGLYDFSKIRSGSVSEARLMTEPLAIMETAQGYYGAGKEHADEYSLGLLAVEYLTQGRPDSGIPDLVKFCEELGRGVQWQDAFFKVFGQTPEDFYDSFEKYRQKGFG